MSDLITIQNKNIFATDSIWWLRIIIIIQIIVTVCLVAFIIVQYKNEPEPIYFPLKQHDELIDSVPLDQPLLSYAEILNWVTEAMIVSFSFNYHNYEQMTEKTEEYFDSVGLASYFKMISEHSYMQQVVSKKLILSGRPTAAPRIMKDMVVEGRYVWQVELPFVVRINNQNTRSNSELLLNILVVRVPELTAPLGVKIVKIEEVVKPKK